MARKITIDLLAEAADLVERAQSVSDSQDDLVEKLEDEFGDFEDVPSKYIDTYDQFEAERKNALGNAYALVRQVLDWDASGDAESHPVMEGYDSIAALVEAEGVPVGEAPSEVVVQSLTTGQLASIQDRVAEASFDYDVQSGDAEGTPKSGYGMVETLRESVVSQPPGAPTREENRSEVPDPAEYDHQVGMYLYDRVDNLSTTGDADLGNSSLRERMS